MLEQMLLDFEMEADNCEVCNRPCRPKNRILMFGRMYCDLACLNKTSKYQQWKKELQRKLQSRRIKNG